MQLGMEDGDEMLAMLQLICLDFSAIVSGISFFLGYRLINVSSIIYWYVIKPLRLDFDSNVNYGSIVIIFLYAIMFIISYVHFGVGY